MRLHEQQSALGYVTLPHPNLAGLSACMGSRHMMRGVRVLVGGLRSPLILQSSLTCPAGARAASIAIASGRPRLSVQEVWRYRTSLMHVRPLRVMLFAMCMLGSGMCSGCALPFRKAQVLQCGTSC
jgi:hypothetical protein